MSEPIVSGDAAQVTTRRRNCARFSRDYELLGSIPMRHLERTVLGCDYGATSWTTRREAGRIAELLGLNADMRLLDVGAGAGWPGLYIAQLRLSGRADRLAPGRAGNSAWPGGSGWFDATLHRTCGGRRRTSFRRRFI